MNWYDWIFKNIQYYSISYFSYNFRGHIFVCNFTLFCFSVNRIYDICLIEEECFVKEMHVIKGELLVYNVHFRLLAYIVRMYILMTPLDRFASESILLSPKYISAFQLSKCFFLRVLFIKLFYVELLWLLCVHRKVFFLRKIFEFDYEFLFYP